MQLTNKEKLEMCLEHLKDGKSLSHICERYKYKFRCLQFCIFSNQLKVKAPNSIIIIWCF